MTEKRDEFPCSPRPLFPQQDHNKDRKEEISKCSALKSPKKDQFLPQEPTPTLPPTTFSKTTSWKPSLNYRKTTGNPSKKLSLGARLFFRTSWFAARCAIAGSLTYYSYKYGLWGTYEEANEFVKLIHGQIQSQIEKIMDV